MNYVINNTTACDIPVCKVYGLSTTYVGDVPDELPPLTLWEFVCSRGGWLIAWNVDEQVFANEQVFRTQYFANQGSFGVAELSMVVTRSRSSLNEDDVEYILEQASWMLCWSANGQVELARDLKPKGFQRGMASARDCTCEVLQRLCPANDLVILPKDFYHSPMDFYFKPSSEQLMQECIDGTWSAIVSHPAVKANAAVYTWDEDLMAYRSDDDE